MPKRRPLEQGKDSADTQIGDDGPLGSALDAAVEALGVRAGEVLAHREYSDVVVIVTRDGRKLTYRKKPEIG